MDRNGLRPTTVHNRHGVCIRLCRVAILFAALLGLSRWVPAIAGEDAYAAPRTQMVETIKRYARLAGPRLDGYHLSPRILEVMGKVPRHAFLPKDGLDWLHRLLSVGDRIPLAYADRPLPIGYGQTMSQPFIVALMTDVLAPEAKPSLMRSR